MLALLSFSGANLDTRFKRLGLFAIGFGLLAGAGTIWIALQLGLTRSGSLLVLTFLLTVLAEAGMVGELYRQHRLRKLAEPLHSPQELMLLSALEQDDAMRETLLREMSDRQKQREAELRFSHYLRDYLKRRVTPLGKWPLPAAAAFWASELLLAGLAAVWVSSRWLPVEPEPTNLDGNPSAE